MPIQLNPKPEQIAALRRVAGLGQDILAGVIEALNSADPIPLTPGELIDVIRSVEPDETSSEVVAEQAMSLYGILLTGGVSIEDVIDALTVALNDAEIESEWWTDEFTGLLSQLLRSSPVRAVAKAATLAYEHMHLYRSARVITDVRPVFDEFVHEIDGAIISHNLRLEYFGRSGSQSLSITLDTPDLNQLMEQCERASRKADLARCVLREGRPINAIILGGDNDNGGAE